MKSLPSRIDIIQKFIQAEIDENKETNGYIRALNECTTLEDLIEEVRFWKNPDTVKEYGGVANYILLSLDNE